MNRRIKKELSTIRDSLAAIADVCDDCWGDTGAEEEPTEEELEEHFGHKEEEDGVGINWSKADEPEKEGVYFKDLRELTELKGLTIIGEIKTVFDLKSYVGKDGEPGLIYRFVLSDPTGDVTCITFDDMAKKFKEFTVGQNLKITNAWKMQENKHKVRELHVGNFAKVEIVE